MYRNILVAYPGNSKNPSALYECTRLLAPDSAVHVHVLVVIDPPPTPVVSELGTFVETTYDTDLQIARERVEEEAQKAGFFLKEHGLQSTLHIECGDPVQVITELVEKLAVDLIIIGHSRQKPFALRWWRGATDTMLVEKVRCSVLVAADTPHG